MIFSFLFGVSFYIQMSKRDERKGSIGFFIWRLVILFVIGMIHALLYRADILGVYAFLGLFLLFFRSMPTRFLIIIGVLMAINLPTLGFRLIRTFIKPKTVSAEARLIEPVYKVHNAYFDMLKNGTYSDLVRVNSREILPRVKYRLGSGKGFVIFGLFLIGLAVGKMGLFNSGVSLEKHFRVTSLGIIIVFLVLALSYLLLEFSTNSSPGSQ